MQKQRTERTELAIEIALLVLISMGLSVIVNLATDLAANTFLWAAAATVVLAAIGLIRMRYGHGFFPASRLATAAVCVATLGLLLGTAGFELARPQPSSCTTHHAAEANVRPDPRTHIPWKMIYDCPTRGNAAIYEHPTFQSIIGAMNAESRIWVVCWTRTPGPRIWYYTQGDISSARPELHAWGFITGRSLDVRTSPDPAIRRCPAGVT